MELYFLDKLKKTKNLLGFSGGVDSVAMFFSLLEAGIDFDIAIVNYGTRETSDEESLYAQALCEKYNKRCFALKAPKIHSNFECEARGIRYRFFEKIIVEHNYTSLILAHHLNDKLEWFLMQLTKGAGLNSILGFEGIEVAEGYEIIRPFINITKTEIYEYASKYKFYEDITNEDRSYKRNEFRLSYSNDLVKKYAKGIRKSFEYLHKEKQSLYRQKEIFCIGGILYFEQDEIQSNIYIIDKCLKKMGYVLSFAQREEIIRTDFCCQIAGKYTIEKNQNYLFVSKIHTIKVSLPKQFKEISRKMAIPSKIRVQIYEYLCSKNMGFDAMNEYLKGKFIKSSRDCQ